MVDEHTTCSSTTLAWDIWHSNYALVVESLVMKGKLDIPRPSFGAPAEVVNFIKRCIEMNDAEILYGACSVETSDFWKDYIFKDFREIQRTETLEAVFLRDGQISTFPANTDTFKLGGHDLRTRHLHIDLEKLDHCWFIKSIWKCR